MAHLSSNPVADAQDHIHAMDRLPVTGDHTCDACKQDFGKGYGVKITDEKFCHQCIKANKHYQFYREAGWNDRLIYEITFQISEL